MTNLNWIKTLNAEQLAFWIVNVAPNIGRRYNDSESGLMFWLEQKHRENSWETSVSTIEYCNRIFN